MLNWITKHFRKQESLVTLKGNAKTYSIGGGWGYHIHWNIFQSGESEQSVYGHLRFVFTEIKPQRDPRDMFFATVAFIGYVGEALDIRS